MGDNGKTLTIVIFVACCVVLVLGVYSIRRYVTSEAVEDNLARSLDLECGRPRHERGPLAKKALRQPRREAGIRRPPPARVRSYKGGFVNHPYYW